jgi:hypothetical protein
MQPKGKRFFGILMDPILLKKLYNKRIMKKKKEERQ